MKVKELIAQLERFDTEQEVEVSISQHNKVYPVAYSGIWNVDNYVEGYVRIRVSLPNNMHTVTKKR